MDDSNLNGSVTELSRYWERDESGIPIGTPGQGRRRSVIFPAPPPKHKLKAQATLDPADEYGKRHPDNYVTEIRSKVDERRSRSASPQARGPYPSLGLFPG